jgi:hypothetical protein
MPFSLYSRFVLLPFILRAIGATHLPDTAAGMQFNKWLDAFNTADAEIVLNYRLANLPYSTGITDKETRLSRGTTE